jgi:hypothetical protein
VPRRQRQHELGRVKHLHPGIVSGVGARRF